MRMFANVCFPDDLGVQKPSNTLIVIVEILPIKY